MKNKIRIDKIIVERLYDDINEVIDEGASKKRIADFGNGWCYIGITAKAEVSYEMKNVFPRGNRRIEHFTSGGLWGIESDSGEKYLKEIEQEQLEELKNHLVMFNADVKGFSNIPIEYKSLRRKR